MDVKKIEQFCELKNISIYKLALMVGIQPSQLYRYLSGE
ncbi:helix-turn-helix domain-containing protein [Aerococcaceae bacterium NML130460]|nr:helix-turn-helix domain-containing protein [Aerococcaceae bacterium NML130460]